jgi:hypothetical protein
MAGSAYMEMSTTMAAQKPASGEREPALELMAVREKEPVAGYAPRNGPRQLANPSATSSCDGLMV